MISIDYPSYSFRSRSAEGLNYIFDPFRKRWVLLTPEEWVRQNFLQYIHQTLLYPKSLIAVEKGLQLGELKKRFDILLYNNAQKPFLLVECKASNIKLTSEVLQQALRYNLSIPVPYIVITNGLETYAFKKTETNLAEIAEIPRF
jgi:hypothetical protein